MSAPPSRPGGLASCATTVQVRWNDVDPAGIVFYPRFRSPARYGDVLTIHSAVAWVKSKTFRMEHTIAIGDRLCAEGFEVRAWVGRPHAPGATLHARAIPDDVARRLKGGAA